MHDDHTHISEAPPQDETQAKKPHKNSGPLTADERADLQSQYDAAFWNHYAQNQLTEEQWKEAQSLSEKLHALRVQYESKHYNSDMQQTRARDELKDEAHALITGPYKALIARFTQSGPQAGEPAQHFLSPDGLTALSIYFNPNHYMGLNGNNIRQNDSFPELFIREKGRREEKDSLIATEKATRRYSVNNLFYSTGERELPLVEDTTLPDNPKQRMHEKVLNPEHVYRGSELLSQLLQEAAHFHDARKDHGKKEDLALRMTFNAVQRGLMAFLDSSFSDKDQPGDDRRGSLSMSGKDIAEHIAAIHKAAQKDVARAWKEIKTAETSDEFQKTIKAKLESNGDNLRARQYSHDLAIPPEETLEATALLYQAIEASRPGHELGSAAHTRFSNYFQHDLDEGSHSFTQKLRFQVTVHGEERDSNFIPDPSQKARYWQEAVKKGTANEKPNGFSYDF